MISYIEDYSNNGLRIIDMHHVIDGVCQCGREECTAQYKHPKNSGWKQTPVSYALNSISFWEQFEDFAPQSCGWVLDDNHVVIDVDPRNGGTESLAKLEKELGFTLESKSNAVVETGGGGLHFYFTKDKEKTVGAKVAGYEGIDVKTGGGFVITAGSMHISGNTYEFKSHSKSNLADISPIPDTLLKLIEKSVVERSVSVTSDGDDWLEALNCIDPDIDYEDWIRVGMSIHHITNGLGFSTWDEWSKNGSKYDSSIMDAKWHSFGKSKNIVTEATLFHYAKDGGYVPSAGVPDVVIDNEDGLATPVPLLSRDELQNPHGILGDIVGHINRNCLFKRRWAAVGVAMSALSTVIGQRLNTIYDTRFNLINIVVADSSTGKESLMTGARDILQSVGITEIIYGGIKSEQEIYRNLIRHQVAMYMIDEFGLQLAKIKNSSKNGASYHEGTIATILSAFTKANKQLDVTGDLKFEMIEALQKQITSIEIGLSENKWDDKQAIHKQELLDQLKVDIERAKSGIHEPYLGVLGFTTPNTFESSVNEESILQGDVGRMLIFKEYDSNPQPDMSYSGRVKISDSLSSRLERIYNTFGSTNPSGRIEWDNGVTSIGFDSIETERMYRFVYQWFYSELANELKEYGMQAVARRSPELMNKILGLLACEGSITIKDIQYAFSLVYHDVLDKKRIATISRGEKSKHQDERVDSLVERIKVVCGDQGGATMTAIYRKTTAYKRDDVKAMVDKLIKGGVLSETNVLVKNRTVQRITLVQ